MNWWNKIGCFLTGWDKNLLAQCSTASRTQLSKYTSALLILMIIWGVVGFGFAKRYIELPLWGCILTSIVFIAIIIMVERQILLATHKNWGLALFRSLIAVTMAIIGSTIIDQVLFGDDIDKQMKSRIEEQTAMLTEQRSHILDQEMAEKQYEIDSLRFANNQLQAEVNEHPTIIQEKTRTEIENIVVGRNIKKVTKPIKETVEIINPKNEDIKNNNDRIEKIEEYAKDINEKKMQLEDDVRKECEASVGFLEELEAMWDIISERPVARYYYITMFLVLMFLELFVVTSKFSKEECDYEKLVKYQLEIKQRQINELFKISYARS